MGLLLLPDLRFWILLGPKDLIANTSYALSIYTVIRQTLSLTPYLGSATISDIQPHSRRHPDVCHFHQHEHHA